MNNQVFNLIRFFKNTVMQGIQKSTWLLSAALTCSMRSNFLFHIISKEGPTETTGQKIPMLKTHTHILCFVPLLFSSFQVF